MGARVRETFLLTPCSLTDGWFCRKIATSWQTATRREYARALEIEPGLGRDPAERPLTRIDQDDRDACDTMLR